MVCVKGKGFSFGPFLVSFFCFFLSFFLFLLLHFVRSLVEKYVTATESCAIEHSGLLVLIQKWFFWVESRLSYLCHDGQCHFYLHTVHR